MDEEWRPVVGYEGLYEVSNHGSVRALERVGTHVGRWGDCQMRFPARQMKLTVHTNGYLYLALRHPGKPAVKYLVHRLVMMAFAGNPPDARSQVNHLDGDKKNNVRENLEWCSCRENLLHLTRVLKRKRGGSGGYSKLTEEQARAVLADQRTLKEIGKEYGVSLQAIWMIKRGRNWAHLSEPT